MIGFGCDERGVSTALSHALTLGIATVLVALLLSNAGTVLETGMDRGVRDALETTGERLATDVVRVDGFHTTDGTANATTITLEYPTTVANSRYRIGLVDDCDDLEQSLSAGEHCLELTTQRTDQSVYVPLGDLDATVDTDASARGGTIVIGFDGTELGVWNP
ncbi:hypothetical protein EL22_02815 [Halostagnicola sp. A56]|uniref:DUF7266 family protein n=1 Tax=Halostagnicola sp. A56 TaxID=1495067 RepID=UPI00049F7802|nr:hypothetical protein [Halostagnicola sp. A56]KDE58739.1 hypothetical protein EL22_02815 [Halostagnicola sp. A56]